MPGELRILFTDFPEQDGARFVGCENAQGRSVDAGEWRRRGDGLVELVIRELPAAHAEVFEFGVSD